MPLWTAIMSATSLPYLCK